MVTSDSMFLKEFLNRLKDCFLQDWRASVNSNSKLTFYSVYKNELNFEKHLDVLGIRKFRYIYMSILELGHTSLKLKDAVTTISLGK